MTGAAVPPGWWWVVRGSGSSGVCVCVRISPVSPAPDPPLFPPPPTPSVHASPASPAAATFVLFLPSPARHKLTVSFISYLVVFINVVIIHSINIPTATLVKTPLFTALLFVMHC